MTNNKAQYIFWDNDGVLVDTERYYLQASREALGKVDVPLSDEQFASISLLEGRSVFDLASAQGRTAETIDDLRNWRDKRYAELLSQEELIIAGVKEVLKELHGKVKMAIVTSSHKNHFDIIHKRTGLLHFFDFCLTRGDYNESKPSAEPYLLALQKATKQAHQTLVIEDSPRGLTAAKAAGIPCWVVPGQHTSKQDFTKADKILTDIREIPELVL